MAKNLRKLVSFLYLPSIWLNAASTFVLRNNWSSELSFLHFLLGTNEVKLILQLSNFWHFWRMLPTAFLSNRNETNLQEEIVPNWTFFLRNYCCQIWVSLSINCIRFEIFVYLLTVWIESCFFTTSNRNWVEIVFQSEPKPPMSVGLERK